MSPSTRAELEDYEQLKGRLFALLDETVPPGATTLVVGRDDALLRSDTRRAWHFPRSIGSGHPARSEDAIGQIETIRTQGSIYLVFPATELWWLDHYGQFREYLYAASRAVVNRAETAVVFELPQTVAPPDQAKDVPLHILPPDRITAELVSRAELLAPGKTSPIARYAGVEETRDIRPAIDLSASAGIERELFTRHLRHPTYVSPPTRFLRWRDCYVLPGWAVAFADDGAVNGEAAVTAVWLSPDLSTLPGLMRDSGRTWATAEALHQAPRIDGPHVLLRHAFGSNYGHWMMDCLPGAWVLREEIRAGRLRLLSAPLQDWQKQTLDLLGVPSASVTEADSSVVRCDHLIMPSFLSMDGFGKPSPLLGECFGELRRNARAPAHSPGKRARLFVGREPGDWRAMSNQPDLIDALEKRGFSSVFPRQLSIAEQIQLFAGAECVVGEHGSGMFNVAYMDRGCHVVEISPVVSNGRLWIGRLCAILGLRFAMLLVDVADDDRVEASVHGRVRRDLHYRYDADIPAVLHALDVFGFH